MKHLSKPKIPVFSSMHLLEGEHISRALDDHLWINLGYRVFLNIDLIQDFILNHHAHSSFHGA